MFADMLKKVMTEKNLKQTQLVTLTGCSKAAVSQYLSGKNEPSDSTKRTIATALDLNPEFFSQTENEATSTAAGSDPVAIRSLGVEDVARILHMNHNTIRKGLQQGVFPWGYAIRTSQNRWVYYINAVKFMETERVAVC